MGSRGTVLEYKNPEFTNAVSNMFEEDSKEHSRKPTYVRELIDQFELWRNRCTELLMQMFVSYTLDKTKTSQILEIFICMNSDPRILNMSILSITKYTELQMVIWEAMLIQDLLAIKQ